MTSRVSLKRLCLVLLLTSMTACMARKGPRTSRLLDADLPANFDFLSECGLSKDDASNPDYEIFTASYQSLPIRVTGSSAGIGFRVTTTAKVDIQSKVGRTTQAISVFVNEAAPTSNSFFAQMTASKIKQGADDGATSNSGVVTAAQVPMSEWIRMNLDTESPLSGVICAGIGTSEIQIAKPKQSATIRYSPPIIFSPNPKASLSRLQREFSNERTFKIEAQATGNSRSIIKGNQIGFQTIRAIDPVIEIAGETIEADAAWEILFSFPKGAFSVGLPSRQAFYLNSKTKKFSLIVTQSDQVDSTIGSTLPPAYLIPQTSDL